MKIYQVLSNGHHRTIVVFTIPMQCLRYLYQVRAFNSLLMSFMTFSINLFMFVRTLK